MLASLYVENIAIIKSISIDFTDGFTILTGETGAGKSILIDSIGLILGGKSKRELIGSFGTEAFVKSMFIDIPKNVRDLLKENNISLQDDQLFIERKIAKDGRSIAKINGVVVPISFLQELAPMLINIHGQHDHILMLNNNLHLEYLDKFIAVDKEIASYQSEYKVLREMRQKLQQLQQDAMERELKLDRLGFILQEFEDVKPSIGMLEKLQKQKKILQNQKEIKDFLHIISTDDGHSLLPLVSDAIQKIEKIVQTDVRFKELFDKLAIIQDLASSIIAEGEDIASEFDITETLSEVEDRLYALQQLLAKYGPTEQDLLIYWEETQKKFEQTNTLDRQIEECKQEYIAQLHTVQKIAALLSKKRQKGAMKLGQLVQSELSFLDMNGVLFEVSIENSINDKGGFVYNKRGYDKVEFLISTNVGQAPKPLHKIASGGELSRIMLSLTNVLHNQSVGTMIFDEVDTGVSGKTAEKIGVKLKQVSNDSQVICITHLAQIASMGKTHYKISKSVVDGSAETKVVLLDRKERIEEVSRIIGGINITDTIRSTAKEMLEDI